MNYPYDQFHPEPKSKQLAELLREGTKQFDDVLGSLEICTPSFVLTIERKISDPNCGCLHSLLNSCEQLASTPRRPVFESIGINGWKVYAYARWVDMINREALPGESSSIEDHQSNFLINCYSITFTLAFHSEVTSFGSATHS